MYIVRNLLAYRLRRLSGGRQFFYGEKWTPNEIRAWQLARFNELWQSLRSKVPYFQSLGCGRNLPSRFTTWQEFRETMPVMDRKTVQREREALMNKERAPDFWGSTGGSTAEPLQFPVWKSEKRVAAQDMWYARSWFGVTPSDKLFLIWGHSHLLGSGFRGWLNGAERRMKDAVLGYCRFSAYDLSERKLQEAAETLLEFHPTYVIAYASALDRFARVNRHHRAAFRRLGLKVAIATAESFPKPDSAEFIADVLGCPVVMEYGAAETGPIAHQGPNGRYAVFWPHYFLEGCKSEYFPKAYEIYVTNLFPRCLPLIRYRVGDLVSANPEDDRFDQEFEKVIGRCNDYVILKNDGLVHSEAFTHVIRDFSSILGYQVIQSREGKVTLRYAATESLGSKKVAEIKHRLERIHPDLASVDIVRTDSLEQTIAGKTRFVRRE